MRILRVKSERYCCDRITHKGLHGFAFLKSFTSSGFLNYTIHLKSKSKSKKRREKRRSFYARLPTSTFSFPLFSSYSYLPSPSFYLSIFSYISPPFTPLPSPYRGRHLPSRVRSPLRGPSHFRRGIGRLKPPS